MSWAPPANYYQSPQPGTGFQTNSQGEWAPPTNLYQSSPPVAPPPGQWSMPPNYQAPPAQQQWAPPVPQYPSSVPPSAALPGQFAPAPAPPSRPNPGQLEYTIPPKYNGDILDNSGTKVYHLTTTSPSSTIISGPNGEAIGRIDWAANESHTIVALHRNKWTRDQFLHPNSDKTHTFRVNHQPGGYTWTGFKDGIQCYGTSNSKVAEFAYRTKSTITLDPAHAELVELVIVSALLIHHEKSHIKHGGANKAEEKITEGLAEALTEAVIKGLSGGV